MPEQPACTIKCVSPPKTAAHGKGGRSEAFQGLHLPILIAELHGSPHSAAPTAPMRWGRLGLQRRSCAYCWEAGCQESGHEARLHLVKATSSVNDCRAVPTSVASFVDVRDAIRVQVVQQCVRVVPSRTAWRHFKMAQFATGRHCTTKHIHQRPDIQHIFVRAYLLHHHFQKTAVCSSNQEIMMQL